MLAVAWGGSVACSGQGPTGHCINPQPDLPLCDAPQTPSSGGTGNGSPGAQPPDDMGSPPIALGGSTASGVPGSGGALATGGTTNEAAGGLGPVDAGGENAGGLGGAPTEGGAAGAAGAADEGGASGASGASGAPGTVNP